MNIIEVQTKNVISKSKLPDADFVINPYVGCQHGCIYCYADFMKRFTGHTNEKWGEFVDIKINSADTIQKVGDTNKIILIGSVTDPYQQIEKKYEITRKILSRLIVFQPKIEILTKSALILRDIDLLSKFKNLRIGISLNSVDAKVAHDLEPFAATPNARLRVLKTLKQANINSYLFVSPIFPFITDYKELISRSKDFVNDIYFENLNIRANNRVEIFKFIENKYPHLIDFYKTLSSNNHFWASLKEEISEFCSKENVSYKIYFNHSTDKK
jgi:DNA repair photolyase